MQKLSFIAITSMLFWHVAQAQTTQSDELTRPTQMTQATMVEIVKELVGETEGSAGNLSFTYEGIAITMVSDVAADRMRLVAAVIGAEQLEQEQLIATLVSNYHLALDARYAIGGNVLYSTYIHPLSPLSKEQLLSGIRQVASLSKTTFGVQIEDERVEI